MDMQRLFDEAERQGRVGIARKTATVDARPAEAGEVVVTVIAGEGKETQSRPARAGDMVVRSRGEATGHEQYLVAAEKFASQYEGPDSEADAEGWRAFRPTPQDVDYLIVREEDGSFTFVAPWGEDMVARPGDAIVRDPRDPADIYRVAATAFSDTYEIQVPPAQRVR